MTDPLTSSSTDITEPSTMIRESVQWPDEPAMKQRFSLPLSIIYYILKNPLSARGYNKLIQCCKYFFEVCPIIVVPNMKNGRTFCPTVCRGKPRCCVPIDITKFISRIKFWFVYNFVLDDDDLPDYTSIIRPKIYRGDIEFLYIQRNKVVTLDDFKFFASYATQVSLDGLTIKHDDGSVVQLEEILESIPDIKLFFFAFDGDVSMVNDSTLKNIGKLQNFKQLEAIKLFCIPECFSVEDLSTLIKDNKRIAFQLDFHKTISDDYKDLVDDLIEEVIESRKSNRIIWYRGQGKKNLKIMQYRYLYDDMYDM